MERRTLGDRGPEVPVIGLGCNNFGMRIDADATAAVVHAALDAGVTHFDTAEMYGGGRAEEFLGAALGRRRDEAFIATKYLPRPGDETYEPGSLARRIREGCDISLRRLGTDRIDLYYQHYPDADAPLDEAWDALEALVAAGKVRHLASSNVTPDLVHAVGTRVVATQIEWNLLHRDVESAVVPAAREVGIGVVPYFPLASGLLSGKYRKGEPFPEGSRLASSSYFASVATDENLERVERLRGFAEDHGRTMLELAVSWLVAQDAVSSVICGATTPEQVRANAAAGAWRLTADDLADIDAALT